MGVISQFWKKITTGYKLFLATVEILKITYGGNITTISGGSVTGDDLILKANSIDSFPKIELLGTLGAYIQGGAAGVTLGTSGVGTIRAVRSGTDAVLENGFSNDNLFLRLSGTGKVKFGTETTNAGSDRGKLVNFLLADGTSVYLKTYDTV